MSDLLLMCCKTQHATEELHFNFMTCISLESFSYASIHFVVVGLTTLASFIMYEVTSNSNVLASLRVFTHNPHFRTSFEH